MDWSSREMVDTFSCYEDEVDIVGEGELMMLSRNSTWILFCLLYMWSPLMSVMSFLDQNGWSWSWSSLAIVGFLLRGMFVVISLAWLCERTPIWQWGCWNCHLWVTLFIPKCITVKGFCSIGGCFGILCLRDLACKIMNNAMCSSKRNSKPICDNAKAYGSMIPCMFPTLWMSVKAKICLPNNSSKKWL